MEKEFKYGIRIGINKEYILFPTDFHKRIKGIPPEEFINVIKEAFKANDKEFEE